MGSGFGKSSKYPARVFVTPAPRISDQPHLWSIGVGVSPTNSYKSATETVSYLDIMSNMRSMTSCASARVASTRSSKFCTPRVRRLASLASSGLVYGVDDEKRLYETYPLEPLERSEEHTSELQSPCNLVCRLL